jgi:hypothetical protein
MKLCVSLGTLLSKLLAAGQELAELGEHTVLRVVGPEHVQVLEQGEAVHLGGGWKQREKLARVDDTVSTADKDCDGHLNGGNVVPGRHAVCRRGPAVVKEAEVTACAHDLKPAAT